MKQIHFEEAARLLLSRDGFHIYIHAKPDGDALGSAAALFLLLRAMGKRARVVTNDTIPARLDFLADLIGRENIVLGGQELEAKGFRDSFPVTVDVASDELLSGRYGDRVEPIALGIDHHLVNTLSCEKLYLNQKASSTGEIIYDLARYAIDRRGETLDAAGFEPLATALYAAIASDTGCFRYGNTSPKTHRAAAWLMERGANAEQINRALFDVVTKKQIAVERIALENMEFHCGGRVAITHLSVSELARAGAAYEDAETISQLPRRIEGVEVGVYIREQTPSGQQPKAYKFSVRANNEIDLAKLCSLFGGGGHKKAAGCTIEGEYTDARDRFLAALEKEMKRAL